MSPHGTVLPSTDETRSYLIGWWCFLSSCRKESFSALRTAERSSTGMFTSPKARAPFQMDAIVPPPQGTTRAIHHLCTFRVDSSVTLFLRGASSSLWRREARRVNCKVIRSPHQIGGQPMSGDVPETLQCVDCG